MSIHAKLSTEALEHLKKQRRTSTISSIVVSVLLVTLIFLVLGIFLLPNIVNESPTIVTYQATATEEDSIEKKKVSTQIQRKPSAPAHSVAKVIASNAVTPTSIPVPEIDVSPPSVEFGMDEGFGSGWSGNGMGDGSAGGGGGFGSSNPGSGGLKGFYYALEHSKDSSKKKPKSSGINLGSYQKTVQDIQSAGFPTSMLSKYYSAPKPLYLTNLAIPNTPSVEGPALFGAEWLSNGKYAKNWLAHYSGTVTVPKTGTYRFSGTGDNYLHVQVDGKPVLHFGYAVPNGWSKEVPQTTRHQSPFTAGWIVHYGKWIPLRAGQKIRMDIGIGDGGGMCGFHLQIEEKNMKYKKDAKGRPILPLFTTAPFSQAEVKELREKFPKYPFDFENVLVFSGK